MGFLNQTDDDDSEPPIKPIGSSLKRGNIMPSQGREVIDTATVKEIGVRAGFDRTVSNEKPQAGLENRRGRPPLGDDMVYWRIYIDRDLRDVLTQLRDKEGRRLNDLLADMLGAYQDRGTDDA